ncbi:hypothetical protein [uncultured Stenotrophomonas sp.]|uniref:hypothetical protein n=1 Tax=uncultured Stenotrophomonas sp. TaxID=165438 RepID=UPI0025D4AB3A|nr:hypothetical protein [uncultured Stenotrophomonas sp.]
MNLGKDLVVTVGAQELVPVAEDVIEALVDSSLDEGLLKDLPFLSTIFAVGKFGFSVRDRLLSQKIVKFLNEVATLSWSDRARAVDELAGNDGKQEKVGALLLDMLDKADMDEKPRLLGKLFVAMGRGEIRSDDYLRMATMINGVYAGDLRALAESKELDSLTMNRRFALQANGFLQYSIKNPINPAGSVMSMKDMGEALYNRPFEFAWAITDDGRTILRHCF